MRDQLGSVVGVADAGSTRYSAYGTADEAHGEQPLLGYAGMLRDPGTALYLTEYRAYDPAVGRWISRDPIAELGGENIYAYVAETRSCIEIRRGVSLVWRSWAERQVVFWGFITGTYLVMLTGKHSGLISWPE